MTFNKQDEAIELVIEYIDAVLGQGKDKFGLKVYMYIIMSIKSIFVLNKIDFSKLSPKLEGPRPPKLVSMHFTSTSTCMIFLSRFYFLTPMDYSPWSERKFLPFLKASKKEP